MLRTVLIEMVLFLLIALLSLPLASAQATYYVRPTSESVTPSWSPCEDCLTLSEYASEPSRYFSSMKLTLVFLPGEHTLNTSMVFQLLENVTLVGNISFLQITSKIVCNKTSAFQFINVSKIEIKALAFVFCGSTNGSVKLPTIKYNLDMLLEQSENMIPSVSALFVPNFHFIGCHMEHCHLPLLLTKSRIYLKENKFVNNKGFFGGAVAAYNSTSVFLGQNTFRGNVAEVGGGVFARSSHLAFRGSTTFSDNTATFGGGGISAIDSSMDYNGGVLQEPFGLNLSCDGIHHSNVHTYMQNSARFGGGILLVRGYMKQSKGTLYFTANSAIHGGGLRSYLSSVLLDGLAIFRDNSAKSVAVQLRTSQLGLGGAVDVWFSAWTSTVISFIGNSAVHGGAISSRYSQMNFTTVACKFVNTSQEVSSLSLVEGCIHMHLVNNSAVSRGGALRVYNSTIGFSGNSYLEKNSASDGSGGGIFADDSKLHFKGYTTFLQNSAGSPGGGGLSVSSTELCFEGYTTFIGNSASSGGGVEARTSSLAISGDVAFISNTAHISGGGVYLIDSILNVTGAGSYTNNTADISGGAIYSKIGSILLIEGEHVFSGNSALHGGAIAVDEGQVNFSGDFFFLENQAVYGGAIFAIEGSYLVLRGKNTFVSNTAKSSGYGGYGGGIHAVRTKIVLSGLLNFTKNSARYGGGLSVAYYGRKHFIIAFKASVHFYQNFAQKHGGAVLIEDAPINYCASKYSAAIGRTCFFKILDRKHTENEQILQLPSHGYEGFYAYVHECIGYIEFEGNLAKEGGNDIYGGGLHSCGVVTPYEYPCNVKQDSCRISYVQPARQDWYVSGLEAVAALVNMSLEQMTTNSLDIASDAFKVCSCDTLKPNCTRRTVSYTYFPGETVSFPLVAVGQANGIVPAIIHAKFSELEGAWLDLLQTTQTVNLTCTNLRYTLFSNGTSSTNLTLSAEGPCGESGIPLIINVSFLRCLDGFALSQYGSCECERRLQKYTNSCDINSRSITRSSDFWVGIDDQSHNLILHPHCPFDYCTLETVTFTLDSTDLQCAHRRSGTLCGACYSGLSLNLGSSQCSHCSNRFVLLIIPFAIAGFLLVIFLFICKVTVSAGTTSGLIFYANVLAANQSVFFPSGVTNFLTVFIAWLNLDLGIETCLFSGMDTYIWTWLQFVFPLYIWLLVCVTTVLTYYSTRIANIIGPANPVSVLATLFLLSYTKLLRAIIAISTFTTLDYPNDRSFTVWAYDGNIAYFEGKHVPLFLASLLVFLFLCLPYTLLLLFGQYILAGSNHRLLSWANNLKVRSFLDAHYAPYKNQHRYWTGLLLLIRFLLFIISAVVSINSPRDPSVNLLVLVITCAGLLTWTLNTGSMYKKWYNNVLESSFILNLAILAAASYHVKVERGNQAAVVYTSVSVAFATFLGVITYHVTERIKGSSTWRNSVTPKLQFLKASLSRQQHDQDSIEMAVPPTAPPPPVTTTFVDLREPLLESQQ